MLMQEFLLDRCKEATLKAFPELEEFLPHVPFEVTQSTQEKFGHYQYNSAMKLSKMLQKKPREIAEGIVQQIGLQDGISNLEVAGPGFINITLDPSFISDRVDEMAHDAKLGVEKPKRALRVVLDFSSPNTAKEMHVGHLRSTIIGDCLARLFEFLGHETVRLNHIGDWGTAFGMLIAYMKEETPEVLTGKEQTDLTHLVTWYKESKKRFDADPAFKKRAQLEVVSLQGGDPESLTAWDIICDISRKAYQEIYDLLDIKITERGESFYNPMLANTVADLEKKELVTVSDGAKCIFLEGFQTREGTGLPLIIQKSDGGYTYATTDMAAIRHRTEEEKADRILYVIDAGQNTHLNMVFRAAGKAGYLDPKKTRVDHVVFGLVLGPDGKKFRTRSGETERLIDLIQTAINHAKTILEERTPDMPKEEKEKLARALGIGAIKYADLACHRTGDYTFSYDRMLRFEGNTAAFLMYAYVRVAGIKRKIQKEIPEGTKIALKHRSEIALGVHLLQFSEALSLMAHDLLPHRLTEYLFALAEKFNAFYRDCQVEGTPEQDARLLLCETVARTLKQGLEILGVKTVERM